MNQSKPNNVAIIGAGLSGLSLALALHAQSIKCAIYERHLRSSIEGAELQEGSGVMLSPNALRILDDLGMYERLSSQGYSFEKLTFKNGDGETTGHFSVGNAKLHGYGSLRIRRQLVINELLAVLQEREVPIHFDRKFSKVIQESEDGVVFEFDGGAVEKADLLLGADGTHSSLRCYVSPNTPLKYSGFIALTSTISISKLRFPYPNYPLPISITARPGLFLICPQKTNGDEVFVGTQYLYPEQTEAGWENLLADKRQLLHMIRRDYRAWPDIVRSALEALVQADIRIWPLYIMPRLERWFSMSRKIILVGDSAHTNSLAAIEGVNQAFEDVYTLSILLDNISADLNVKDALKFWQELRQERIDKLNDLMLMINNQRLLTEQPVQQETSFGVKNEMRDEGREMGRLYEPDWKKEIMTWIQRQNKV